MRRPQRVVLNEHSSRPRTVARELLARSGFTIDNWRIYLVQQQRGRCYLRKKTITIPAWALNRGNDFFTYYVAHELAHAVSQAPDHGPEFMEFFKRICPPELQHFEYGYKPRNAAAAGVQAKQVTLADLGL